MPDYPGSGGWRASNIDRKVSIGADIPFLASEKYTVKRSGATFKKASSTAAANEVQTLAASSATAGTFTLTFQGQTTSAIAYNASAATIATALAALSTIGTGNVSTSGGPANTTNVVITFTGALAGANQPYLILDKSGLTGGSAAAITETTRGSAAGVAEIKKGTFVHADASNPGYYKVWATGDTIITDGSVGQSGFLMQSINVADGDVTEGVLIQGSVLGARLQPTPLPSAVLTAIAGRIIVQ